MFKFGSMEERFQTEENNKRETDSGQVNSALGTEGNKEIKIPQIKTRATDSVTGSQKGSLSEHQMVIDSVFCTGLIPGEIYMLHGSYAFQETGEIVIDGNGNRVTTRQAFQAKGEEQEVEVLFEINSKKLEGEVCVVQEELLYKGRMIASHVGLKNPDQEIHYPLGREKSKALYEKMLQKAGNRKHPVLEWLKSGNDLSARMCSYSITGMIKTNLIEERIPFLTIMKKDRMLIVVRNCDERVLTQAAVRSVEAKQRPNLIYHAKEFEQIMGKEKKNVTYIKGLSELEVHGLQKEIGIYGSGVVYSIARMADNSWILAAAAGEFRKKNIRDITQMYLRTMMRLYGPNGKHVKKQIRKELLIERRISADIYQSLIEEKNKSLYFQDAYDPLHAIAVSKEGYREIMLQEDGSIIENRAWLFSDGYTWNDCYEAIMTMRAGNVYENTTDLYTGAKERKTEWNRSEDREASGEYLLLKEMREPLVMESDIPENEDMLSEQQQTNKDQQELAIREIGEAIQTISAGEFCASYLVDQQNTLTSIARDYQIDLKNYSGVAERLVNTEISSMVPEYQKDLRKELEYAKIEVIHEKSVDIQIADRT